MTRQTFFLIAGIVLMLMTVAFTVHIYSSDEEIDCYPHADYDCYQQMVDMCAQFNGENSGDWLAHSWCSGETCYGAYRVYCDIERWSLVACGYVVCYDINGGFGCQNW